MKKTLTIISSAVLALAIAIPGIAGSQLAKKATANRAPQKAEITLKAEQQPAKSKIFEVAKTRTAKAGSKLRHSLSNMPLKMRNAAASKILSADANLPTIYGSVVYNTQIETPGLYEVSSPTTEVVYDGPDATYGGVYVDGVYYTTTYQSILGIIIITQGNAYDAETGELIGSFNIGYDALAPSGYAVDPTTGDVYGITYNAEATAMQLSKADFTTTGVTTTKIADLDGNWNALACDKNGQLYAINYTMSGDYVTASYLNKIDKATGEVTLIGETGQLPQYLSSAAIDPKSNRMFWNVCPPDETGWLCEVNLETGVATQLFEYEAGDEICGMYVPYLAEDGAPATVENLQATFEEGSLSGTVSFKAPTTLFDGTAASGNITYSILANGVEVKTGTTTYGATVSEAITVENSGNYTFNVTVSNEVGKSPNAKVTVFVGKGTPAAPKANLTYTDGNFNLTWNAITTSVDGGYLNPASVTYKVTRYPGAEVVAAATAETSFTEEIEEPTELTEYYYTVVANADGMLSAVAQSNIVVLGAIEPPYSNNFNSADDLAGYAIIDNNGDNRSWTWYNGAVRISYNPSVAMDDYLITPPMKLIAGNVYNISFKAYGQSTKYPERVEAKLGMQPTADGLDIQVVEPTTIVCDSSDPMTISAYVTPQVTGNYYLGIHGISDADTYYLYVDDIEISAPVVGTAPNIVNDIVITPSATGALEANISFKAPELNLVEGPLASLTKIEVRRNGDLVKLFINPAIGETLSFTDYPTEGGDITYTFQAFNEDGAGLETSATAFVGFDVPKAPTDVTLVETGNTGEVTISWSAVTEDVQGKPLPSMKVSYVVTDTQGNPVSGYITGTSYTLQAVAAGEQDFAQYAVFAITDEGQNYGMSDMIAVGTPYNGIQESFANATLSYIFGLEYPNPNNYCTVSINTNESISGVEAADGDNGYVAYKGSYLDAASNLFTGKIDLTGMENPGIKFYTYNLKNDNGDPDINEIQLLVKEPGDDAWTALGAPIVVNDINEREGWNQATASLAAYAGKTVQVGFQASVKYYVYIMIDNIKIGNLAAQDLAVSAIEAPENATAGESYTVSVTVANEGMDESTAASVELYADGQLVDTKEVAALASGEKATVSFERAFGAVETEPVVYYAKIVYAADENLNNNTSENISVAPKFSSLPKVNDLAAEKADGGVKLTWTEPDLSNVGETKVVDFEDGTAGDVEYEGWTFVDVDGQLQGGFQNLDVPGIDPGVSKGSFFIFDASPDQYNDSFGAHSGDKYLASIFNYNPNNGLVDDWAISPELDGTAQTISFWAKSYSSQYPEQIQMLYSTTGLETSQFVAVRNVSAVPGEWTEYTFDVPEGAKYFAIRSYGTDAFMLMLDDFTFSVASASANLSIVGYDVYRDGVKITKEPTAETEYVDTEAPAGKHSYVVVVVYDKGTSAPSNVATVDLSGVGALNGALAVKAGKGNIAVSGAEGELVTVAAADGKVVYNSVADGKVSVDVPAGVYVVKAGKKATKVVVK